MEFSELKGFSAMNSFSLMEEFRIFALKDWVLVL